MIGMTPLPAIAHACSQSSDEIHVRSDFALGVEALRHEPAPPLTHFACQVRRREELLQRIGRLDRISRSNEHAAAFVADEPPDRRKIGYDSSPSRGEVLEELAR
jgi:hypothetical protein